MGRELAPSPKTLAWLRQAHYPGQRDNSPGFAFPDEP